MKNAKASSLLIVIICLAASACSKGGPAQGNAGTANTAPAAAATPAKTDAEFAREAFGLLAAGDHSVEQLVDWENFKALGEDYGAEYRKLPEDVRAEERRVFVEDFSDELRESGGEAGKIANWREESRAGEQTVVAADQPNGATLLVGVTRREGRQLLTSLDVREK